MSTVRHPAWRRALGVFPVPRIATTAPSAPERFMLWVDSVGAFLVCTGGEVTFGQATADSKVDVPLVADIARRHATIRRDSEGYVVEPHGETWLDERPVTSAAPLADQARLRLGAVALRFVRPHPLSATARVRPESPQRVRPSCDAVILLSQSCGLGPKSTSHIVCPDWQQEVALFYTFGKLTCHVAGELQIDGRSYSDSGPLRPGSRVAGDGFSFSLESV